MFFDIKMSYLEKGLVEDLVMKTKNDVISWERLDSGGFRLIEVLGRELTYYTSGFIILDNEIRINLNKQYKGMLNYAILNKEENERHEMINSFREKLQKLNNLKYS